MQETRGGSSPRPGAFVLTSPLLCLLPKPPPHMCSPSPRQVRVIGRLLPSTRMAAPATITPPWEGALWATVEPAPSSLIWPLSLSRDHEASGKKRLQSLAWGGASGGLGYANRSCGANSPSTHPPHPQSRSNNSSAPAFGLLAREAGQGLQRTRQAGGETETPQGRGSVRQARCSACTPQPSPSPSQLLDRVGCFGNHKVVIIRVHLRRVH